MFQPTVPAICFEASAGTTTNLARADTKTIALKVSLSLACRRKDYTRRGRRSWMLGEAMSPLTSRDQGGRFHILPTTSSIYSYNSSLTTYSTRPPAALPRYWLVPHVISVHRHFSLLAIFGGVSSKFCACIFPVLLVPRDCFLFLCFRWSFWKGM